MSKRTPLTARADVLGLITEAPRKSGHGASVQETASHTEQSLAPARRNASSKAKETHPSKQRVKGTFRFDTECLAVLEAERLKRIQNGVPRSHCDLSDLINEAIRKTYGR